MRPEDTSIAIIGEGVVGGALRRWFESRRIGAGSYDPPKGLADKGVVERADIVFICVPTPYARGRGFDDAMLLTAARAVGGEKTVVIKSTVLPGTTAMLQERLPQHRWIFNPEFLREASALEDMMRPDRQIIGCTPQSAGEAERLLALLPPAPFVRVCASGEAEMAKYMANSFLAAKVSFANEFHDLCVRMGIDYAGVRDVVAADERIGASHLDVFAGGYRGYGGKCLPKDSMALLELARSFGVDMRMVSAARDVNEDLTAARGEESLRQARIAALERDEPAEAAA